MLTAKVNNSNRNRINSYWVRKQNKEQIADGFKSITPKYGGEDITV